MPSAIRAGAWYFAFVFAAGFVLGTVRILLLIPAMGEGRALLLEIPVMLAISWVMAGALIRRHGVPARVAARLLMGGVAFALLMLAEALLGIYGFGRSLQELMGHYATLTGAAGLAGQGVFALIPVLRLLRSG